MPDVKTQRKQALERRRSLEEELREVNEVLFTLDSDMFFEMAVNALAGVTAYYTNAKGDLDNSVGWNIRHEFAALLRGNLRAWYEQSEN